MVRGTAGIGAAAAGLLVVAGARGVGRRRRRVSDYDNQADAQRAADTKDADGDGIYCEALPCPCLKRGESNPPRPPVHAEQAVQAKAPGDQAQDAAGVEKPRADQSPLSLPARWTCRPAEAAAHLPQDTRAGPADRAHGARRGPLRLPGGARTDVDAGVRRHRARHGRRRTGRPRAAAAAPARVRALVDIRTDAEIKPRDGQRRLRAYLDAGHTGVDLGHELVAAGWAEASYGEYARSQRMLKAQKRAERADMGAWMLCHARFDRPASERFTGYTACPATFNVDGERYDDGVGFVRNVIVAGGGCESGVPGREHMDHQRQ